MRASHPHSGDALAKAMSADDNVEELARLIAQQQQTIAELRGKLDTAVGGSAWFEIIREEIREKEVAPLRKRLEAAERERTLLVAIVRSVTMLVDAAGNITAQGAVMANSIRNAILMWSAQPSSEEADDA